MDRGIENVRSGRSLTDPFRLGGMATDDEIPAVHALDSEAMQERHKKLLAWLYEEREKQAPARYQMALDEDFADGIQWSEEDARILEERGQAACSFNLIAPQIRWLTGTEKRARVDYRVLPRRQGDDAQSTAEAKEQLLKYLSDVNHVAASRSRAFKDAAVVGLGWLEDGQGDIGTGEPIYSRYESWRNILHDSCAQDMDFGDGRYLFRWRWVDQDIGEGLFPDRIDLIKQAVRTEQFLYDEDSPEWFLGGNLRDDAGTGNGYAHSHYLGTTSAFIRERRPRCKLYECWYRIPSTRQIVRGGVLDGATFDPADPQMMYAIRDGVAEVFTQSGLEMRVAVMTEGGLLFEGASPYWHQRFPFTPIVGYRRARDGTFYGVVRGLRDPQTDYNKRASKAQWILASNQVVMDEGAVDDINELVREVARPDGVIVKRPGKSLEIGSALKNDIDDHVALMERDHALIREISGITGENLGRDTNANSGRAILAKQEQGSVTTADLFDNHRYAVQIQGEKQTALIEQFVTQPKVVRIVGERGGINWLQLNQVDPATGQMVNSIASEKADFVVQEQDYRQSLRQAMFESLSDMLSRLSPDVSLQLLDLVFEFSDLPNKDELVQRVRKLNGQTDPEHPPSPEEQAEAAAQQKAKAEAEQIASAELRARVEKLTAEAEHIRAKTGETRIDTLYSALQGAQVAATVPHVAPVADSLLSSSGFNSGPEPAAPVHVPEVTAPMAGLGVRRGIETLRPDGIRNQ